MFQDDERFVLFNLSQQHLFFSFFIDIYFNTTTQVTNLKDS